MSVVTVTGTQQPSQKISDEDRRRVLTAARGPEPPEPLPDVIEQFLRQVARRPEHPAVQADDGTLTFRELDRVTAALARRLRQLGVRADRRVGVAVPRGARELTALVGTLRAGGGYVPIDPTHPIERVRVILGDAQPEVLIAPSGSPLIAAMPEGVVHLPFDRLADADSWDGPEQAAAVDEGQLAYALFTSGSTGRPKGVEIPRGALSNFLRAMTVRPGFTEDVRILAITTTTFDIAELELLLPLWTGGTTIIVDRDTVLDPRLLRARIETDRPTLVQATPATWRLLLEAGWTGHAGLRMIAGGEALNPSLAERLLACGSELWNQYGPTETTVYSTVERVSPGDQPITIGRPIDFTQVYVLDANRALVAPGEVGEIYIAGRGLGRGYLGRPDLTAERFVPDPYGAPGARMYRTGDLGRLLPDGRFECLGRIDHQVKIRGFRIELGEIEATLRSVPGVKEVLVMAIQRPGSDADPSLAVYFTGTATRDALYEQAQAHLPGYMVPAAYVNLPAFPLNTNGKIDRKALPPPESTGTMAAVRVTGPRNSSEERMAAIWSDVLGLGAVGIDQDFFALGGNSARVVEARAKIEKAFAVELPLRAFYETPTIEHLVTKLGEHTSDAPIVVPLRRGRPDLPAFFCLLGIDLYQDLARAVAGERSVYGIHVPIRYRPAVESRPGVEPTAARYLAAIRERQPHGPYYLGGFCFGGVVTFEVARQLEAAGERVPVIALFDADLPSAARTRWGSRIMRLARRALNDPADLAHEARRRSGQARHWIERRLARSGAAGAAVAARVSTRAMPVVDPSLEIEVPADGPDDAVITAQYERTLGVLRETEILVFRAAARDLPGWMDQADHLGWEGHAPRLKTCNVDSGHMEMLHPPHVARLAAAISDAIATDEATAPPPHAIAAPVGASPRQ